jgi:hypothetical protein
MAWVFSAGLAIGAKILDNNINRNNAIVAADKQLTAVEKAMQQQTASENKATDALTSGQARFKLSLNKGLDDYLNSLTEGMNKSEEVLRQGQDDQLGALKQGNDQAVGSYREGISRLDPYADAGKSALANYMDLMSGKYTGSPVLTAQIDLLNKSMAARGMGYSPTDNRAGMGGLIASDYQNQIANNFGMVKQGQTASTDQATINDNMANAYTNYGKDTATVYGNTADKLNTLYNTTYNNKATGQLQNAQLIGSGEQNLGINLANLANTYGTNRSNLDLGKGNIEAQKEIAGNVNYGDIISGALALYQKMNPAKPS